jgi:hypothetical protein
MTDWSFRRLLEPVAPMALMAGELVASTSRCDAALLGRLYDCTNFTIGGIIFVVAVVFS